MHSWSRNSRRRDSTVGDVDTKDTTMQEQGIGGAPVQGPLWRKLADTIRAELVADDRPAGTQLPTELQLGKLHGVSRFTVRRAIAELESQGLVRVDHGRGLFVAEKVIPLLLGARTRLSDNLRRMSLGGQREYLGSRVDMADAPTREALALQEGAEVVVVELVVRIDNRPIALARNCYPLPRFDGIGDAVRDTGSTSGALRSFGVTDYFRKSSRIATRLPTALEAERLEIRRTQPLLTTLKVDADANGQPIAFGESCFPGDRVNLVVE